MAELKFDPIKHKYSIEGRDLPSVTTLLKNAGMMKALSFYTDAGATNGSRRHLLTELYDKATLDYGSIALDDMPYLEGWINAKADLKIVVEPSEIEVRLYHPVLGYAGTADRICLVNGVRTILDIKNGAVERWHNLQLILYGLAYAILYEQPLPELMGVYLKKTGKYKFKKHNYQEQTYAIAAAKVENWKGMK